MMPRVVITAGASGIGLSIARHFVQHGALVAICDIDVEALNNISNEFSLVQVCDVTDAKAVNEFVTAAAIELGGVDTVIANAGTAGPTANLEDVEPEDWCSTLAVNLTGQYTLLKAAIPLLKERQKGSVILMSSAAGRLGIPM